MSLYVNAYVVIDEGCPISISVSKEDRVGLVCGWPPDRVFEFTLHREALRALVELGTDALQEMDNASATDGNTGSATT